MLKPTSLSRCVSSVLSRRLNRFWYLAPHLSIGIDVEPHKLRRWRRASSPDRLSFFTCARPGRSAGNSGAVPDAVVEKWVRGLPGGAATTVISLLGWKPDGLSEFSFYSFSGSFETAAERRRRISFAQWLQQRCADRGIQLIEHPTTDFKPVSDQVLDAATRDIEACLLAGRTAVLVDSGGETRTRQVCKRAGLVEDSRS